MKLNQILKQQLEKISVSKQEERELKRLADSIIKKIPNSKIGGSFAKSTLIKKQIQDVDIFVTFNSEKETKKLEEIIRKAKLDGKARLVHGSRDYVQIQKEDVVFEIIPVVSVSKPEEAENVTDVSLMHVDHVKRKISRNKKLGDEIKLAKSFCFANEVYGAESYIGGFSGYALEVLIIYFGGFIKFLKDVGKKKILDPEKKFKTARYLLYLSRYPPLQPIPYKTPAPRSKPCQKPRM